MQPRCLACVWRTDSSLKKTPQLCHRSTLAATDETINGRLDMLNGIATALQKVTENPAPKLSRVSDLIPRNPSRRGHSDYFVCFFKLGASSKHSHSKPSSTMSSVVSCGVLCCLVLSLCCVVLYFNVLSRILLRLWLWLWLWLWL